MAITFGRIANYNTVRQGSVASISVVQPAARAVRDLFYSGCIADYPAIGQYGIAFSLIVCCTASAGGVVTAECAVSNRRAAVNEIPHPAARLRRVPAKAAIGHARATTRTVARTPAAAFGVVASK
jgi:hypothetical protein